MKRFILKAGLLVASGTALGGCPVLSDTDQRLNVELSEFVTASIEKTNDHEDALDISGINFIDDEETPIYDELLDRFGE